MIGKQELLKFIRTKQDESSKVSQVLKNNVMEIESLDQDLKAQHLILKDSKENKSSAIFGFGVGVTAISLTVVVPVIPFSVVGMVGSGIAIAAGLIIKNKMEAKIEDTQSAIMNLIDKKNGLEKDNINHEWTLKTNSERISNAKKEIDKADSSLGNKDEAKDDAINVDHLSNDVFVEKKQEMNTGKPSEIDDLIASEDITRLSEKIINSTRVINHQDDDEPQLVMR